MFVLFIYHFWTRNRQILNFEHFELFFARFYSVKRTFSTKWWPGEENAPKIIFFAFLVYFYINTKYIKLDRNSENFLIFWCTLLYMHVCIHRNPTSVGMSNVPMHVFDGDGLGKVNIALCVFKKVSHSPSE